MTFRTVGLAVALTMALSGTAAAQSMAEQRKVEEACRNDIYTFCVDALPDHARISACLRKQWKRISAKCRRAMGH